jgi:hypothetical protein
MNASEPLMTVITATLNSARAISQVRSFTWVGDVGTRPSG